MKNKLVFYSIILLFTISFAKDVFVDVSFDSKNGDGSLQKPYRSIQTAVENMSAGDVCYIRKGTYRETVIPASDNITITNYKDEYVLITGLDELGTFESYKGNIKKTSIADTVLQVFVNGKRMNWARFPDEDGVMLSTKEMAAINVGVIGVDGKTHGKVKITGLPSKEENFWEGAWVVGHATKKNWFTANKGKVISSSGENVTCYPLSMNWENMLGHDKPNFIGDGKGYIIGHLGALTVEKEWVWKDGTLYLYPPEEAKLIEGRTRVFGMDLSGKTGINVTGVHFKAAAIKMEQSIKCTIENCSVRYPGAFSTYTTNAWGNYRNGDGGIYVSGKDNIIKDCYIGRTWSHGVSLLGERNTIENCVVLQCNWIGERMSPIFCAGKGNIVKGNTVHKAGREGIELGNAKWVGRYAKDCLISNNHIYNVGFLCPDGGVIYANQQGGSIMSNTTISYNICHDYKSQNSHAWGGIYLDNSTSGFTLHHNVVYNVKRGVMINSSVGTKHSSHDIYAYHNTFFDVGSGIYWNTTSKVSDQQEYNIVVKNNHSNGGGFMGIDKSNNRNTLTKDECIDFANGDYRLKETSLSINKGVKVAGINDEAVGLPDLGAFEFGGSGWVAGSNIEIPYFPDEDLSVGSVAINERILNSAIVLRKNPMHINLNVKNSNGPWSIDIIDMRGRRQFVKRGIVEKTLSIPSSSFAPGVYCVVVKTNNQKFVEKVSLISK